LISVTRFILFDIETAASGHTLMHSACVCMCIDVKHFWKLKTTQWCNSLVMCWYCKTYLL